MNASKNTISKVLNTQPDMNSIRFDYANLLADKKQYDEALVQYEKYLEEVKDNE